MQRSENADDLVDGKMTSIVPNTKVGGNPLGNAQINWRRTD
jgi:hypothetical protein